MLVLPTMQERLDSVYAVLPQEQSSEMRQTLAEVDGEDELREAAWGYLKKKYPITILCEDKETLRVYAAFNVRATAEELGERLKEAAKHSGQIG